MQKPASPTTPELDLLVAAEPDLVDRIFDYILAEIPQMAANPPERVHQLKAAVRAEFKGEECYIASRPATARQEMVAQVLALFNGRNASEVARRLHISRASVYRVLKQPGTAQAKQSQFSGK